MISSQIFCQSHVRSVCYHYCTILIMSVTKCFVVALLTIAWPVYGGTKLDIVKKCCNLGTNYADSGLQCSSFQTPIAGISKEDESYCLHSIDLCCKKQYRHEHCELGKKDVLAGKPCGLSSETTEEDIRKDCCEACEFGLEASKNNQPCVSELGLGLLLDSTFESCCKKIQPSTEPIISTSSEKPKTLTSSTIVDDITTEKTTKTTKSISNFTYAAISTKSLEKYNEDNPPPPPSLEALCDIPDICAQICTTTKDSYKCSCYEGFTLMADGISCKPSKRPAKTSQRCTGINNPCDHQCIDTGVAIKCLCDEGYELGSNKRTCKDIDECALGLHDCLDNEVCVNMEGDYDCQESNSLGSITNVGLDDKCPDGYKFDGENMVCNDIDECEIGLVCPKPSVCINTVGSFKCQEENTPQCPPGFYFKDSIQSCDDIDECITGKNDCNKESQVCLNTKGNYTCTDKASKKTCPPGFKKNLYTQQCEDINECEENYEICGKDEVCINEPGGHNCIPKSTSQTISTTAGYPRTSVSDTSKVISSSLKPYTSTPQSVPSFHTTTSNKIPKTSVSNQTPQTFITSSSQKPISSHLYPQVPKAQTKPTQFTFPVSTSLHKSQKPNFNQPPYYQPRVNTPVYPVQRLSCTSGFKFSMETNQCSDIDECKEEQLICDSNQDCYNTVGSYICNCKHGFTKDYQTGACVDVNECQVGQHDCGEGQRCDNTIGSYLCARTTGCGTGYTLNSATGLCEDDNECLLGTHNCGDLGSKFQCRNTLGSYRCERIRCIKDCYIRKVFTTTKFVPSIVEPIPTHPVIISQFKKCLPGYKMNQFGACEDIDECSSNPCKRSERCLNLSGRYQCIPFIQCKSGYELNEAGSACIDINECIKGTHKCKSSQICKNGPGYYICQCPPGHKLNAVNECEDIDECEYYRERICSRNSHCINTVGSYKCQCKEGFRENGALCEDIDECVETPGLCHQNCVNLWGTYRCSCERGFTLSSDNRTCTDINECEKFKDKHLCIGTCQNTPGSYSCKCPEGYRIGIDGRTCQDIDECQRSVCRNSDDICVNTRGGFKCHTITCPPNYIKDPEHKSRCKRASNVCDIRDINCIRMPSQYSYHFVTFVSNLPIPDEGKIDFFQMKGPSWSNSNANFNMNIMSVRCPRHIKQAGENYFRMKRDGSRVVISLIRSIEGPQDIELQLQMELYVSGVFQGKVMSTVFIFVSDYEF